MDVVWRERAFTSRAAANTNLVPSTRTGYAFKDPQRTRQDPPGNQIVALDLEDRISKSTLPEPAPPLELARVSPPRLPAYISNPSSQVAPTTSARTSLVMSELKNRSRASADARDVASTSDFQSSLLLPSKPIKGRKRSSSNVGQRFVLTLREGPETDADVGSFAFRSRALIPLSKEYLLRALPDSSARIASIQKRLRTPLNDKIFLWSGMVSSVHSLS